MLRYRAYIPIVLLAVLSPAVASGAVDVRQYAALRKSASSGISLDSLKSRPASYCGKTVEIRGRLSGKFKNGSQASVIIATPNAGSFVLSADSVPQDSPGVELACLVKVTESGELSLRAWTYAAELARYEEKFKPRPRPKQQQPASKTATHSTSPKPSPTAAAPTLTAEQLIRAYRNAIKQFNRKLSDAQADTIARSILGFSYKYKVDARLVCAVILAESNFKVNATSRCGAIGLGQLMPTTAAGLGVNNAYDPVENVYGSTRYIKSMLDRVSGSKHWNDLTWYDLSLALAAYNAGPGAVKKHSGIPPYTETQNYVRKVVQIYKRLCGVS